MPQGGVEGPFPYMLAMLPLMRWIAREYAQLPMMRHTSPAGTYVDDAVPIARDKRAQQVVQDLMQRYGWVSHLVWSTEKLAVLGEGLRGWYGAGCRGRGGVALEGGRGCGPGARPDHGSRGHQDAR